MTQNPKKSSNGRKTSVSQLWGLTMSLYIGLERPVSVSCHLCHKSGDFLALIWCKWQLLEFHHIFGHFSMPFSDLFWICPLCSCPVWPFNFHHVFFRFILNFSALFLEAGRCRGRGAESPTWFNPSGALTIFGLLKLVLVKLWLQIPRFCPFLRVCPFYWSLVSLPLISVMHCHCRLAFFYIHA